MNFFVGDITCISTTNRIVRDAVAGELEVVQVDPVARVGLRPEANPDSAGYQVLLDRFGFDVVVHVVEDPMAGHVTRLKGHQIFSKSVL